MNISKLIFKLFSGVKVVHSIPGRMRVQINGLNTLNKDLRKKEEFLLKLLTSIEGINDIEVSYITNKILIFYSIEKLSEEKIISWLKIIEEEFFNHLKLLEGITEENFEEMSKDIFDRLKSKLV